MRSSGGMEAGDSSESVVTSYKTKSSNPEKHEMDLYSHGKHHPPLPKKWL
jgi:hypothetical protein